MKELHPKTGSLHNQQVRHFPGVAELADAADSKSAGDHSPCGFDSLLRDSHFLKSLKSEEICDFGGFLKSRLCNGVQPNDAKTGNLALN